MKKTKKNRAVRIKKALAIYGTMVVVSTLTIAFLEHTSIASAFRTALVAALGKTIAVSFVGSYFED